MTLSYRDRLVRAVALSMLLAVLAAFTPGVQGWFVGKANASYTYSFTSSGAPTGNISLATGSAYARVIANPPSTITATVDQSTGAMTGNVAFDTAYTPVFDGPFHLKLYVAAVITPLSPISGTVNLATGAITATSQLQIGVTVYHTANPAATCTTTSTDTSTCIETPATDQKLSDATKCITGPITQTFTGTFDKNAGTVHIVDPQFTIPPFGNNAQGQPVCGSTVQGSLNQQLAGPNNSVDLTYSGTIVDSAPSISGVVTDANTGAPVAGANVRLYPNGNSYVATALTTTDSTGHYTFHGVAPGTYQLQFADSFHYLPAWYSNGQIRPAATPLTLAANVQLTANQALAPTTVVTGVIKDSATSAPLGNTMVYLMTPGGAYTGLHGVSDASGAYTVAGVPPGTWDVEAVRVGDVNQWYLNSPDQAHATALNVSGPSTANFAMVADPPSTASVSGTVTDAATGLPVAGASVRAWKDQTSSFVATATTDAGGHYVLAGIAAGAYQVQYGATGYQANWWSGATVRANATKVTLTGTTAAIQNVTLTHV